MPNDRNSNIRTDLKTIYPADTSGDLSTLLAKRLVARPGGHNDQTKELQDIYTNGAS